MEEKFAVSRSWSIYPREPNRITSLLHPEVTYLTAKLLCEITAEAKQYFGTDVYPHRIELIKRATTGSEFAFTVKGYFNEPDPIYDGGD